VTVVPGVVVSPAVPPGVVAVSPVGAVAGSVVAGSVVAVPVPFGPSLVTDPVSLLPQAAMRAAAAHSGIMIFAFMVAPEEI
jgi:hypothetical protein